MTQSDTFTVGNLGVAVEESADALVYAFAPRGAAYRPQVPLAIVLPFVGLARAVLGLTFYAYSKATNRPDWELALTAVFAAQLLAWLILGTVESGLMLRWSLRGIRTELRFASAGVRHGADRVCALEDLRGLRLFTYRP